MKPGVAAGEGAEAAEVEAPAPGEAEAPGPAEVAAHGRAVASQTGAVETAEARTGAVGTSREAVTRAEG
jgi:hypothetical protein